MAPPRERLTPSAVHRPQAAPPTGRLVEGLHLRQVGTPAELAAQDLGHGYQTSAASRPQTRTAVGRQGACCAVSNRNSAGHTGLRGKGCRFNATPVSARTAKPSELASSRCVRPDAEGSRKEIQLPRPRSRQSLPQTQGRRGLRGHLCDRRGPGPGAIAPQHQHGLRPVASRRDTTHGDPNASSMRLRRNTPARTAKVAVRPGVAPGTGPQLPLPAWLPMVGKLLPRMTTRPA